MLSTVIFRCFAIGFLVSWSCPITVFSQSEPTKILAEIPRSLDKVPNGTEVIFDLLGDSIRVKSQVDSVVPISVNVSPLKGHFTRDELIELSTLASFHSQRISRIQSTFPNFCPILPSTYPREHPSAIFLGELFYRGSRVALDSNRHWGWDLTD